MAKKKKKLSREARLRRFLRTHRSVVREYQDRHIAPAIHIASVDPVSAIEWIFLNAINAAGGSVPLGSKQESVVELRRRIAPLRSQAGISFDDFVYAITESDEMPEDPIGKIVTTLCSGKKDNNVFPHVGLKKANLFLRDLVINAGAEIFTGGDLAPYVGALRVPIDVVHEIVFCMFHQTARTDATHEAIKEWTETLFPRKPVQADDLWFWGHFVIKRRTVNKERFAKLERGVANMAMLEADLHLALDGEVGRSRVKKLAEQFTKLILPRGDCEFEIAL